MKNKFIPATGKNIEEFKKKFYNELLEKMIKDNLELFKGDMDFVLIEDMVKKDLKYLYNPKEMKKHKTYIPNTQIDIYDYISEIQKSSVENELIILLDENKRVVESKIISIGDETSITNEINPGYNAWKYILSNKETKYFIHVHNHPKVVVSNPSLSDEFQMVRHKMIGNLLNIKMLDSCIITEFDFYSQFQYEQSNQGTPILNYWKTNKFKTSEMIDENLAVWSILRKSLED